MRTLYSLCVVVVAVACGATADFSKGRPPPSDGGTGGGRSAGTGGAPTGCTVDTECKGTRVCERGRCVEPSGSGGTGAVGVVTGGRAPMSTGGAMPAAGGAGGLDASIAGTGGALFDAGTGASPGNGGIGSGCASVRVQPEPVTVLRDATVTDTIYTNKPVAVLLMQDRSSSMVGIGSSTSQNWSNAVYAMSMFVQDPKSVGLDVGLAVFPPMSFTDTTNQGDCSAGGDCGNQLVPIAPLPANATAITNGYAAAQPSTTSSILLTPTECALRGLMNGCLTFMAESQTGEQCVAVLLTDGAPTTCDTKTADLASIVADGHSKGVVTFVIGLAGADTTVLNALALSGGTDTAFDASGGIPDLVAALDAIRKKIAATTRIVVQTPVVISTPVPCEWVIPPPPVGQVFDANHVNVSYEEAGGPTTALGYVPGASECSTVSGPAWYYDDANAPTRLLLCPAECSVVSKFAWGGRISVDIGCPTVPAR